MAVPATASSSRTPQTPKEPVDSLIHARWLVPVRPSGKVLQHHSLAISQGVIRDILDTELALQKYRARQEFTLTDHVLIPGLINAHGHAAMTLFRGLADDLPLLDWLHNHIWPAEQRWVGEDFVATGTELAVLEMLLGGTTCFADMYFFPNIVARIAHRYKLRAHIFVPIVEFPTAWAANTDEYFTKGLKLHDDYRNHPLIRIGFGPHAPYTVTNESLHRIRILAEELDLNIQMHLHETAHEIEQAQRQDQRRPIQRLDALDLLSPRLQCVHMTQVNDDDLALLKTNGCHVIHCPESNLKLASGFSPVAKMLGAGINVALGTDGSASNNDLDLLGEAKTAALLAKGVAADASVLSAHEALAMATINGAQALGIDQVTGSLEIGKAADIAAVDLGGLQQRPVYDPVSQLIYGNNGNRVSHVWAGGHLALEHGLPTTTDLSLLDRKVEDWRVRIAAAENQQVLKF